MGVAERSREHVEDKMTELEATHGSFDINQTTITLPGEQYTSMRERGNPEPVSAYIAVRNEEDDVLHVDGDEDLELPGVQAELDTALGAAICETVRERTGVDCVIEGIEQVTIAGLRNGGDPNAGTLYNLVVVFNGSYQTGAPTEETTWQQLDERVQPAYA
ncbi:hypothetical protein [Salinibaculum salinum]|uniref:hypothetical protein n=1 Tax=Salinibaculum salinum TaxID=3131996 RepID=UPI0030EBECFA